MTDLLNSITSDNLVLLCVIMGVVALFLAIAIAVEIYNNNKQYNKKVISVSEETNEEPMNIQEDSEIKYVDEDSELEKTKAKIELAELREKLKKEEEEKRKLLEMNLELAKKKEEEEAKVEVQPVEVETPKVVEDKEAILDQTLNKLRVSTVNNAYVATSNNVTNTDVVQEEIKEENNGVNEETIDNTYNDEENAIISFDELKQASSFGYTDEEMDKYVDEKDAIISIQELEQLYKESLNIEVVEEPPKIEFEMKRVEDLPKISEEKIFQSTPFISPVYGTTQSETDLVLEQTANLEKLNEEIRKTNEFLKTLKDLKKNLE